MTDVVDGPTFLAQTGNLQMQELHAPGKQPERHMHVRTYFFWYIFWSARTWLALCGGDCAVLCCARVLMLTDNTLVRTFAVAVYRYSIKKKAQKTKSGKKAQPAV